MRNGISNLRMFLDGHRGVLVDSNILLDIATQDPVWCEWSTTTTGQIAEYTALIINPIVFAEVSVGYKSIEAVNLAIPESLYEREALPWEAGFLAGKCFAEYRRRGGTRHSPLPDFYIGAHAAVGHLG